MLVKDFIATKQKFQRVYLIPLELKGKNWGCCPSYFSAEEVLKQFAEDECEYRVITEPDCIKRNLVIYTAKVTIPGMLFL